MTMKKLTVRVLPLLLVFCMILSACGQKECAHANTELQNVKAASCIAEGYAGDLVCRDCGTVIAAGVATAMTAHAWSDWTVTKDATATEEGSRTHVCTVCGASETQAIPAIGGDGNHQRPDDGILNTYLDLLEAIYEGTFGFQNGTATFVMNDTVQVNMTVNSGDSLVWMDIVMTEDGVNDNYSLLYRDGVIAACIKNGTEVNISDIDALILVNFEDYAKLYAQVLAEANTYAETYLAQGKVMMQDFIDQNSTRINAIMAELGAPYTADQLMVIMTSLESVYAQLAARLGVETQIQATEGIELPTKEDWVTVLAAFTTVTQDGTNTTYTLDATPVLDSMKAYVTALESMSQMTMAEYLYTIIAPSVTEINPELTDWAAVEAYIRENITGDLTCGGFIDIMIEAVEESEICTLEELYALINAYVSSQTGEEFDCEALLTELHDVTLDELVASIFEDETMTLEAIYDGISTQLNETLVGDIVISSKTYQDPENPEAEPEVVETTFAQSVAMMRGLVDSLTIDALGFSVTLNAEYKIVALLVEADIAMTMGEETNSLIDVKFEVKQDDTAKVVIPDSLNVATGNKIDASYDANGNLVINGLNPNLEYDFDLYANYVDYAIGDITVKDNDQTASRGYDVYVLKEEYWYEEDRYISFIVDTNGTRYSYRHEWDENTKEYYLIVGEVIGDLGWEGKVYTDTYTLTDTVRNQNGEDVSAMFVEEGSMYTLRPTYYTYVDGHYFMIDYLHFVNQSELQTLATMTLTSGATMYIKGEAYYDSYKYVYGYRVVSSEECLWVACRYENDTLIEELYHDTADTVSISLEDMYDVNDYLTKNDAGSYTISATLFNALNAAVTDNMDMYSIIIDANYIEGGVEYSYHYIVGSHATVGDNLLSDSSDSAAENFHWYEFF